MIASDSCAVWINNWVQVSSLAVGTAHASGTALLSPWGRKAAIMPWYDLITSVNGGVVNEPMHHRGGGGEGGHQPWSHSLSTKLSSLVCSPRIAALDAVPVVFFFFVCYFLSLHLSVTLYINWLKRPCRTPAQACKPRPHKQPFKISSVVPPAVWRNCGLRKL